MPRKEQTIMEQKIEFICEWRTGKYAITELCKCFDISRPTAYKIIARFENEGYEGLKELSRKPRRPHPNTTNEKVVERILSLKEKHKLWGAKKLHTLLYKDFSDDIITSVLTVDNVLKKHGLVSPQKRLRRVKPIPPVFDLKAQQLRLNSFVKEYNSLRPHEVLNMKTPASVHEFSTRPFPERILNFDYDAK